MGELIINVLLLDGEISTRRIPVETISAFERNGVATRGKNGNSPKIDEAMIIDLLAEEIQRSEKLGLPFKETIPDTIGLTALKLVEEVILGHTREQAARHWCGIKRKRERKGLPLEFSFEEKKVLHKQKYESNKEIGKEEMELIIQKVSNPYIVLKAYRAQVKDMGFQLPEHGQYPLRWVEKMSMRISTATYFMAGYIMGETSPVV